MNESGSVVERRRVRVWFGDHVIADYWAEALRAEQYADAMARRFAGLRVTNDPLGGGSVVRPLPSERLWDLGPH
ncbi:hypothetical protein Kfla_4641 [Kribbella flavida DSM 17836]|uniref:Uncharacterized protein n=1 Tax=Kribbella flavida (strain DSM 17836 / JCM 10339 / NBRC 14399) TaxID=479435 RepID=D2PY53_KRIFD|nr:hypothetical protein [Kribbella flavida]ADB33659.1 hypothetical protein Kfla_4641 [Kribbella flavida DSM 17836]